MAFSCGVVPYAVPAGGIWAGWVPSGSLRTSFLKVCFMQAGSRDGPKLVDVRGSSFFKHHVRKRQGTRLISLSSLDLSSHSIALILMCPGRRRLSPLLTS